MDPRTRKILTAISAISLGAILIGVLVYVFFFRKKMEDATKAASSAPPGGGGVPSAKKFCAIGAGCYPSSAFTEVYTQTPLQVKTQAVADRLNNEFVPLIAGLGLNISTFEIGSFLYFFTNDLTPITNGLDSVSESTMKLYMNIIESESSGYLITQQVYDQPGSQYIIGTFDTSGDLISPLDMSSPLDTMGGGTLAPGYVVRNWYPMSAWPGQTTCPPMDSCVPWP